MDSTFYRRILLRVLNQALWEPAHRLTLDKNTVQATQADSCYTLLLEPHFVIDRDDWSTAHLFTNAIYEFVNGGGNFYAQCHGVETYENLHPVTGTSAYNNNNNPFPGAVDGFLYYCSRYYRSNSAHGNFLTTKGLSKKNCVSNAECDYGFGYPTDNQYHYNLDLPVAQFQGIIEHRNQANLQLMVVERNGCNDRNSQWEPWSYGVFEAENPDESTAGSGTVDAANQNTNQPGRWWQVRGGKFLRTGSNTNRVGRKCILYGRSLLCRYKWRMWKLWYYRLSIY